MYRKLHDAQPESPLGLELDNKMSSEMERRGEDGSPTEPVPHKGLPHSLSLLPVSGGRLLKSESEDSGVEMASNDHSPSTPAGSEKSFSLDFLDSFQASAEDSPPPSPPPAPHESCPNGEGLEEPGPTQDRAYHRNLSVSKKLAQVVQRSQRHRWPCQSPRQLGQRPRSLEGLKSGRLQQLAGGDGETDAAAGRYHQALSGCSTPEEQSMEEEEEEVRGKNEPSLSMPGQGLQYLEHICQMLEKIAQLQRANLQLQHQQQVMECQIRSQEVENEGLSEGGPEKPGLTTTEPLPGHPASTELEEEDRNRLGFWHSHHFRARSASDTRALRSPAHSSGNKQNCSRKVAAHSASSPSLLDQPDGGSYTLPPGMKLKSDHSHWGKVKVLINRIKRKSVRAGEVAPFGEPTPSSRQCRADTVVDKQESHPRRRFLPTLGAKKRQSKHLSMR